LTRRTTRVRAALAHHAAHVAPENWITAEIAYRVNRQENLPGALHQWRAVPEAYKRVDLCLLPPAAAGTPSLTALPEGTLCLEMKLIDRGWWFDNWRAVHADLSGKAGKPLPAAAVCFLFEPKRPVASKTKAATLAAWQERFAKVPEAPGPFHPVGSLPPLYLAHTSPRLPLLWPHPIPGRWPEGYEADLRILWVTRAAASSDSETPGDACFA
jgi:hypothetical protein